MGPCHKKPKNNNKKPLKTKTLPSQKHPYVVSGKLNSGKHHI
jgi:hypothetical protein